jgi:hypothetical protein
MPSTTSPKTTSNITIKNSNNNKTSAAKPFYANKDCEIILLVDRFVVDAYTEPTFGQRWAHIRQDILDAMVKVNRAYTKQFNIGLPVVRVDYVGPKNDLGTGLAQPSKNLGEILGKLSKGVDKNQEVFAGIKNTCLALVITNQNTGSNLGTAFVGSSTTSGGVCDKNGYNIGVANTESGNRLVSPDVLFGTLAHEIGHLFGASHDDDKRSGECNPPNNPFIMFPLIYATGVNKERFSPCSTQAIMAALKTRINRCFKPRFSVGYMQHSNKVPVY